MLSLTILKNQLAFFTFNGWFSQVFFRMQGKTGGFAVILHNFGRSPLFRTPGRVVCFALIPLASLSHLW